MLMGAFIGSRGFIGKKFEAKLNSLQTACLLFLLGVMGYKIGINNDILNNFHKIGFKALSISVLCILFSILFVKIGFKAIGGNHDN